MKMWRLLPLPFALLALLGVTAALGQGTTGRLIGIVKDAQGGVLPGVTVTISSASLIGGPRVTRTGLDGGFAFASLDPGAYYVRCELESFRTEELEGVQVSLDRTAEVFPRMEVGSFSGSITVITDLPVVDTARAGISSVYSTDYLDRASIGSQGRSYQYVIGRTPGADNGTGNPHVFGSTDGENAYYIDGVDTTDPVTATFGTNLNFDAIKEISFQTAGYPAEFGRATGGVVNIVTKSGGNRFAGTVDTRYSDSKFAENGRHFNRDANKTGFLKPAATLGGPIFRDKLWFFASAEYIDRKTTPTSSVLTRDFKGENYLEKLTWQIDPSWRGVAKYSSHPATIRNQNAGQFVAPATASMQTQPGYIYQLDLSGVLTSTLLVEAQGAVNRAEIDLLPQSGNLDTPAIQEQVTGITSNNFDNAQFSKRNRDELQATVSDFLGRLAGSHEVKAGTSYSNMSFLDKNDLTGGALYHDFNGPISSGAYLEIRQPLDFARFIGKLYSAFLQDAWRPLPALTLQLGVRFDDVKYRNNGGVQVADMRYLQPRLGFAFDLSGDARTLLRGSYGIFFSPNGLTLPSFTRLNSAPTLFYRPCSAFFASAAACAAGGRFGPAGYLPSDPLHRDPLGYFKVNEFGSDPEVIEPGLKAMTTTEYTVGIERQLFNRTTIELSFIHKRASHIFEDTCAENVPTPTPDPNGTNCPTFVVANLPAAKRNYQGALLTLSSHPSDRLHVRASYVYSKSRGSVEYDQNAGPDFDIFPALFVNRYGYLSDDRRHRVRLDGYLRLPLDFSLGIQSDYTSPFPYSKTTPAIYDVQYLAPRGSFRGNSTYNVNLEIRKGFPIGPVRSELIASVFNLLGTEQVTGVCGSALGCGGSFPFGVASDFAQPRHYEVGLRLVF